MSENQEFDFPEAVRQNLSNVDEPVTVGDISALMAAVISHHEAMLALFSIIGKAYPQMIFLDEVQEFRKLLNEASADLVEATSAFAKRGGVDVKPD